MRVLLIAAPLLLLMACTQAPQPADAIPATQAALAEVAAPADAPNPEIPVADVPAPQGTATLLVGVIDYYPVVMYLDISGQSATGHYFYTKKGKPLDLTGTLDARQHWQLTESVKGAKTGYFDVMLTDGHLIGQWSAKPDMSNPLEVSLDVVDVPYEPNHPTAQRINGRYVSEHVTMTYEGDDENGDPIEKEHDVKDEMAVRYLGGGQFAFWISVVGANFHTGEVYGIGEVGADWKGKTLMDDCALNFDFSKANAVSIEEQGCGDYHGARASFYGEMTKKP